MSEKDKVNEACKRVVELYFEGTDLKEALEKGKEYKEQLDCMYKSS